MTYRFVAIGGQSLTQYRLQVAGTQDNWQTVTTVLWARDRQGVIDMLEDYMQLTGSCRGRIVKIGGNNNAEEVVFTLPIALAESNAAVIDV